MAHPAQNRSVVLRVLHANDVAVDPHRALPSAGVPADEFFRLKRDLVVEILRLPDIVHSDTIQRLARRFKIPVEEFYRPSPSRRI